jgi:hypothetical protein
MLLGTIPMRTIHHQPRRQPSLAQFLRTSLDVLSRVIRALGAASEDNVREGVSLGLDDGGEALLGDGEEGVACCGGAHGVDGDVDGTVGAVLEADGAGECRGEFSVDLGIGVQRRCGEKFKRRTWDSVVRAPIAPHEVNSAVNWGEIVSARPSEHVRIALRRLTQKFARGRKSHFSQLQQQLSSDPQTSIDLKRPRHTRIINHSFPAHRCPWLLEVDPHKDQQVIFGFIRVSF